MTTKIAYVDNVNGATADFHAAIMAAIAAGGVLPDELADLFKLTATVVDGVTYWAVDWF